MTSAACRTYQSGTGAPNEACTTCLLQRERVNLRPHVTVDALTDGTGKLLTRSWQAGRRAQTQTSARAQRCMLHVHHSVQMTAPIFDCSDKHIACGQRRLTDVSVKSSELAARPVGLGQATCLFGVHPLFSLPCLTGLDGRVLVKRIETDRMHAPPCSAASRQCSNSH